MIRYSQFDARVITGLFLLDDLHRDARHQRGDAQEHIALLRARLGQSLVRRIPDADARIEAIHFNFAELRMLELRPALEDASLILFAIEFRQRQRFMRPNFE